MDSGPSFHPAFACQPLDDHPELLFDFMAFLDIVSFSFSIGFDFLAKIMKTKILSFPIFRFDLKKGGANTFFLKSFQSYTGALSSSNSSSSQAVDQVFHPDPNLSSPFPGPQSTLSYLPSLHVLTSRSRIFEYSSSSETEQEHLGKS